MSEPRDREAERLLAYGLCRTGIGVALAALPGLAKLWVGAEAGRPAMKVLMRAFAARDAAIGVGTVLAVLDGAGREELRRWALFGAVCDSADAISSIVHLRAPDHPGRWTAGLMAAGAAAFGFYLADRLSDPGI